jgi:hypothetical protein
MKSKFISIILTVAVCLGLLLGPASTLAAGECGIEIQPSEQEVGFNQEFSVDVIVTNPDARELDMVMCHINFSADLIEVINITNGGSPFNTLWDEEFNNTAGYVDYDYSTPMGTNITEIAPYLCTVNMKSKAVSGTATLEFVPVDAYGDPETQVLYAGTDYLGWTMVVNGTAEVVPGATLEGQVNFAGRGSAPNDRWIEPFNVTLFEPGNLSNVLWTGVATTNNTGVFTIDNIPAGTYDIGIKNWTCLSELVTNVTVGFNETKVVDFGTTREGDANNDDYIDGSDFGILSYAWLSYPGQPNWYAGADFNRDDYVDGSDFGPLSANWKKWGDLYGV